MSRIAVRLDPALLDNPDADLRYKLPDLLIERSKGIISDDGYDYIGTESFLVLFLQATDLDIAIACVLDVIQNVSVIGNDLRKATVVAVVHEKEYKVIFPQDFNQLFLPD